jgi:dihydrofolate synthase/folylpolyglutamate synthase
MGFISKKNLHIIYGSPRNKDHISFLKNLTVIASSLCVVEIENQLASLSKTKAIVAAKKAGWKKIYPANSILEAIQYICSEKNSNESPVSILICGSLYLAGEALRVNGVRI